MRYKNYAKFGWLGIPFIVVFTQVACEPARDDGSVHLPKVIGQP